MTRLLQLYKKTNGGHSMLSDDEFDEYAALRKLEYQTRRDELASMGCTNICAKKDNSSDIIGWTWEDPIIPEPIP